MELRQYNTILPSMITLITKRNREILEGLSRHVPSYAQLLTGEFNGIAIRLYGSTVNMQGALQSFGKTSKQPVNSRVSTDNV